MLELYSSPATAGARLRTALLALALGLPGCAQLLDLPENPHLAVEPDVPTSDEGVASPAAVDAGGVPSSDSVPARGDSVGVPDFPLVTASAPDASAPSGSEADSRTVNRGPDGGSPEAEAPAEIPATIQCALGESPGPDGHCYFVIADVLSWEDARARCQERVGGGDLASIRTESENRFVAQLANGEAWIGASDADAEGTWKWVDDGTPFWSGIGAEAAPIERAYSSWFEDEPNGEDSSNCARMLPPTLVSPTGAPTWADLECEELHSAVCEGPAE